MKVFILILFSTILSFTTYGQKVYFKHIDIEKVNDSIVAEIDKISDVRITFLKYSYWVSRNDTTTQPNIYNSYLNFYTDDNGRNFATIVNEYFIYGPFKLKSKALGFLTHNKEKIFETEFRPNNTDIHIDTAGIRTTLLKNPKMPKAVAEKINTFGILDASPSDGIGNTIKIRIKDSTTDFYFGDHKFETDNAFYKYNSKLAIFTFKLLLESDRNYVLKSIDWECKLPQK